DLRGRRRRRVPRIHHPLHPPVTAVRMPNSWVDAEKAAEYLGRADTLPHRSEGETVLVRDLAGALPGRVLDLGCGDGRLTALVLAAYPESSALCVDMSPPMLQAAAERFDDDP